MAIEIPLKIEEWRKKGYPRTGFILRRDLDWGREMQRARDRGGAPRDPAVLFTAAMCAAAKHYVQEAGWDGWRFARSGEYELDYLTGWSDIFTLEIEQGTISLWHGDNKETAIIHAVAVVKAAEPAA